MRLTGQFILAVTVITTILPACSGDRMDSDLNQEQPATDMSARPQRLVRLTDCTRWTAYEFSELMQFMYREKFSALDFEFSQMESIVDAIAVAHFADNIPILAAKFLSEGSFGYHFERQNFLYRSVTATGDSATFSGSVVYPLANSGNSHTLDGWTVYSDFSNTSNTTRLSNYPEVPYFRAALNQAVVFSDTQGFGATNVRNENATVPLQPCYFDNYTKGRQTVDAAIAASQILDMKGILMAQDQFVENMGISIGGTGALSILKYIESETDCPVWVRDSLMRGIRTFVAEGPMDMWNSTVGLLERDESMTNFVYPIIAVTSAFASFPSQFKDYTIHDFFNPVMSDIMVPTDLGDTLCILDAVARVSYDCWAAYGYDELVAHFGTKIINMMRSGMYNEDGTPNMDDPKTALLKMAMDKYSFSDGWTPKSPVLLAYSSGDELAGLDGIRDIYNRFKSANRDVSLVTLSGDHITATSWSQLYMLLNPRPSMYVDKWASILETFKQQLPQ